MNTGIKLNQIHHISIICSDFESSKKFYTEILGLSIQQEIYRSDKDSFKLDLALNGEFIIELFTFPDSPARATEPEACGLRHLAFEVEHIIQSMDYLKAMGVAIEPLRVDEHTHKKYTFFKDPDGLPIELYEK